VDFYLLFRVLLLINGEPEQFFFKETNLTYYKSYNQCVENGFIKFQQVVDIFNELELNYTKLEFKCLEGRYD